MLRQRVRIVLERHLGHESRILLHRVVHRHQSTVGQPDRVPSRHLLVVLHGLGGWRQADMHLAKQTTHSP